MEENRKQSVKKRPILSYPKEKKSVSNFGNEIPQTLDTLGWRKFWPQKSRKALIELHLNGATKKDKINKRDKSKNIICVPRDLN